MPYITQDKREKFNETLDKLPKIDNAGELNYLFTKIAIQYFNHNKGNYQAINDIMGVFSCAGSEFYRRIAVDYEQKKIEINGDCFPNYI